MFSACDPDEEYNPFHDSSLQEDDILMRDSMWKDFVEEDDEKREEEEVISKHDGVLNAVDMIMQRRSDKWKHVSRRRNRVRYGPDHKPGDEYCGCKQCRPHSYRTVDDRVWRSRKESADSNQGSRDR